MASNNCYFDGVLNGREYRVKTTDGYVEYIVEMYQGAGGVLGKAKNAEITDLIVSGALPLTLRGGWNSSDAYWEPDGTEYYEGGWKPLVPVGYQGGDGQWRDG